MEQQIMKEVYLRLHNFIYRKCGFILPIKCKNTSDTLLGRIYQTEPSAFSPDKIGNIYKGVSITNIKGAKKLVKRHRVISETGKTHFKDISKGKVMGYIALTTGLPMFHITIKHNGNESPIIIMPQNPWKRNIINECYSYPARAAQRGDQISWVMNLNPNIPVKNRFIAKITNGNFEYL